MKAFLFIQQKRKSQERIDFVSQLRVAQLDGPDVKRQFERWAREAEIRLMMD